MCNFQVLAWNSTSFSPAGWDAPVYSNIRFEKSIPRPQLPISICSRLPASGDWDFCSQNLCTELCTHRGTKEGWQLPPLTPCLHHFLALNLTHIWSPRTIRTLFKGLGRKTVVRSDGRDPHPTLTSFEKNANQWNKGTLQRDTQHQCHYAKRHTQ